MNRTLDSLTNEKNYLLKSVEVMADDLETDPDNTNYRDEFLALTDRIKELQQEIDYIVMREWAMKNKTPSWKNLLGK